MTGYIVKHKTYFLFGILLLAIYFPIFLHLEYMPIRMWDESILGVSSVEMARNHNYLVPHSFGKPDMWNCKPPLMIWCILICSKLFGFNELSLRLPSALAALILCAYLFFSIRKYTGSAVFGFMVVCVLVTCQGYVRNHVIRTGEYDSLLVLLSTVFSFHLFFATETTEQKLRAKHLLLFFLFVTIAVLNKGIACMMLMPGLLLYVVVRKKFVSFLQNKSTYIGVLSFMVFGLGYYFFRETINAGYLKAVWENELGGRFATTNEGHVGDITFYLTEITTWQFTQYMLLFPFAVFVGLKFSESKISRLVLFALITGGVFLAIISLASTKLPHYDAPLFPWLAIVSASFFYLIYTGIRKKLLETRNYFVASAVAFVCFLTLLIKPYNEIISKVYFPKGDWWEEGFSVSCRIFQDAVNGKVEIDSCKLVFTNKNDFGQKNVLRCYEEELKEKKIAALVVTENEILPNDTAVVFDANSKQMLEQKFELIQLRHLERSNADVFLCRNKP